MIISNIFYQKQQERETLTAERIVTIDKKLKNAYILPKDLGMLFGSFLILLITTLGYVSFRLIESNNENTGSHQITEVEAGELYIQYFTENPEIKTDYDKWLLNQNIP